MSATLKLFGKNFLASVIFLTAAFAAVYFLRFRLPKLPECIGIILSLSTVFSLLLTADSRGRRHSTSPPSTFSAVIHDLLANRQPLLCLLVIGASIAAVGTYYVFTSIVTVQYSGEAGIIFRLPGQTVYYTPILPYGWVDTGIQLEKDERFTVELSGQVSPGALQALPTFQQLLNKLREDQAHVSKGTTPPPAGEVPTWLFTGPEGYKEDWYKGHTMLPVLETVPFYKAHQPGYEFDGGLTVKGYPHNTVIGIILRHPERPKISHWDEYTKTGGAYDKEVDNDQLLNFSSERYSPPLECHAMRAGRLWVVINDADNYRWDNVGFFFLKLTRYSFPSARF
jgi:hypothetical protein